MSPVICLITDRRRFGDAWEPALVDRVRAAARAGVHLVQIRERDLDGGPMRRLTARCVQAVAGTRARVVVNDRVDVALAAGAHGVHLRGDSMEASRVRRIVPPAFLIGRSVHGVEEAVEADEGGALDYLVFGTVFESASKPGREAAGLDQLGRVCAAITIPVLAVGGITPDRASDVARAGAAGIAAIGCFAAVPPDALPGIVAQIAIGFDMP